MSVKTSIFPSSKALAALAMLWAAPILQADEGMWTFDSLPLQTLKSKYGFVPDQAFLDHLRLSALRFPGGSGSFISPDGLVFTNHHVGRDSVQQVSTAAKDFIRDGFLAQTREQEIQIPGLTLSTLEAMENVTEAVNAAVKPGVSEKEAAKVRKDKLEALRLDAQKRLKLQCETVTLYQGGEYWIYGYKRHTDIRLVMAPETGVAAFGGDPDNFTFPRHDMDFTLFRVYENGKPYASKHFLKWSTQGIKAGELTLVVGHPGRTSRLLTMAQMQHQRDFILPRQLDSLKRLQALYHQFSKQGKEQARVANVSLYIVENSLKALTGQHKGLLDAEAMANLEKAEKELRNKVAADAKLQAQTAASWDRIRQATQKERQYSALDGLLNQRQGNAFNSGLLGTALRLWRLAEDPNQKDQLSRGLLADRPTYKDLETILLSHGLDEGLRLLGKDHALLKSVLGSKSPETLAKELVEGTLLQEIAIRKQLMEGGKTALEASKDPMVRLAKLLLPQAKAVAKSMDEEVRSIYTEHGGRIARARFAVYGKDRNPDATGTLRLSFGPVESYPANGTKIQPFTTFHGLYDRAIAWGPEAEGGAWKLPQRWIERKGRLNLETPYNFVSSADIIGGNSGSPTLNKQGEVVGIAFDGNIESLPGAYYFDGRVNRCVSLDSRAVLEALEKIYDAGHLVKEITGI